MIAPARFTKEVKALAVGASLAVLAVLAVSPSAAQTPVATGPRAQSPTVFPAPGSFPTTEAITLMDADPQTKIHYTLDGSPPTADSPLYDPQKLLFLYGVYDGEKGLKSVYTLRAIATRPGYADSDVATFLFTIDRKDRNTYVTQQIYPNVTMVHDSDNDKMFLVHGQKLDVLIDSGLGHGPLQDVIDALRDPSKPLAVIFTHNHGDHIGQADKFIAAHDEYITDEDKQNLLNLLKTRGATTEQIASRVKIVKDQDVIDAGDHTFTIFALPGHTPGAIAIFEDTDGLLFTGDALGSNSPTIPDAAWMQNDQQPVDVFLSYLLRLRAKLHGRIKAVITGHNDHPLLGETYIDNVEASTRALLDKGQGALIPSYRPPGLQQVIVGDRLTDPNWASINVNLAHYLPAPPDQDSRLVALDLAGATLRPGFVSSTFDYEAVVKPGAAHVTMAASPATAHASKITIDGKPAKPGQPIAVRAGGLVKISVTAGDGKTVSDYRIVLKKTN
jgi:glyoxylase-like metal-dependent hydrolase (beta-lactamase superfamily II)